MKQVNRNYCRLNALELTKPAPSQCMETSAPASFQERFSVIRMIMVLDINISLKSSSCVQNEKKKNFIKKKELLYGTDSASLRGYHHA